jgi:hypothetical protein
LRELSMLASMGVTLDIALVPCLECVESKRMEMLEERP